MTTKCFKLSECKIWMILLANRNQDSYEWIWLTVYREVMTRLADIIQGINMKLSADIKDATYLIK